MMFIIRSSNTFNKSEIFKLIQPSQPYLSGGEEERKKERKKGGGGNSLDVTEQTQKRSTSRSEDI